MMRRFCGPWGRAATGTTKELSRGVEPKLKATRRLKQLGPAETTARGTATVAADRTICSDPSQEREVQRGSEVVVRTGRGRVGTLGLNITFELVEHGLAGDVADRATHRACAVQRTLRPLQHFDAVQIEQPDIRLASAAVVRVGTG